MVLTVAWSPDGKHLVSGSKSGEICCWNPKKGELEGSPLTVKSLLLGIGPVSICFGLLLITVVFYLFLRVTRNGLLVSRGNQSTLVLHAVDL